MSSISIRFALIATTIALFILALTGGINYLFLKNELLFSAMQKAQLIEKNSKYHIDALISKTKESSFRVKGSFLEDGFNRENIKRRVTQTLLQEKSFLGMALAFVPQAQTQEPFSPYYYKKEDTILYKDLAAKDYNYLTKEWYKTPAQTKKSYWSKPYFDKNGANALMVTYSNPIIQKEKLLAILTIDLSLKNLQKLIGSIKILHSGYAFILSKNNQILVHPDAAKIMKQYGEKVFEYEKMIQKKKRWIYYAKIENTDLTLGIVFPEDELFASLHYMSIISIILAIVGSILLIFTMLLVSRKISKPLQELTRIADAISKGDFEKKINLPKTKDEVFQLSMAINMMQESIKKYIEDLKIATIKEQRVQSELSIARSIQMSMLPKSFKKSDTLFIDSMLKPAKAVGGDFYDFFYVDEENLCFVIADVSGKGVPAALFMSVTMSYLRAFADVELSARELIEKLNSALASNNDANMFVTLFLGLFNVKNATLNYVNAGHTEPYLLLKDKASQKLHSVGNPIVGAFENLSYIEETIALEKGFQLFLYTDGVTEAFAKDDAPFGEKRVQNILDKLENRDIILQSIEESLTLFTQDCEQSDDITMLLLEFKPRSLSQENLQKMDNYE